MNDVGVAGVFILAVLYTLMQVAAISIYFNGFLSLRMPRRRFYILSFTLMASIKLLSSDTDSIVRLLGFVLLLSICVFVSFRGTAAHKVYHIAFFTLIVTLTDLALSILTSDYNQSFEDQTFIVIVIYFSANFLSLLVVMLTTKLLLYFKTNDGVGIGNRECVLLSIIPCFSLASVYWIFQFREVNQFVPCLALLIVNICIMLLYHNLEAKSFLLHKYSMIEA